MKTLKLMIAFIAIVLLFPYNSMSQENSLKQKLLEKTYIGVDLGSSLYYGDVRVYDYYPVYGDHSEYGWSGSMNLIREIKPWLTIRGQILGGTLAGTKRQYGGGASAQLAFDGYYMDANLGLGLDFIKMFNPESRISLYGFAGIGYFRYWADVNDLRYFTSPNPNIYENSLFEKNGKESSTHFGVGAAYEIVDNIHIYAEGSMRPVLSDRIDGVIGGSEYDFVQYVNVGVKFHLYKDAKATAVEHNTNTEQNVYDALNGNESITKINEELSNQEEKNNEDPGHKTIIKEEIVEEKPIEEKIKEEVIENIPELPIEVVEDMIKYRVQIAASYKKLNIDKLANKYNIYETIYENKINEWYLYSVGNFKSVQEVDNHLLTVRDFYKVSDAFIVKYKGENRISPLLSMNNSSNKGNSKFTGDVVYKIQVLALKESQKTTSYVADLLKIEENVNLDIVNDWNLYSIGSFSNLQLAKDKMQKVKDNLGIEAVIVAYRGSKLISMK